jgi:hypothetical protein
MTLSKPLTRTLAVVFGLALLSACQTDSREQLLKTGKSQVALRSIQSRVFDTTDRKKTLRTVIATMQDLGFVVDKADAVLGSVSGTKFDRATFRLPYRLRMTVTIRPRGESQLMVRANAQYNITPVEDPEPYQNFFAALSKAMFLESQMVGSGPVAFPAAAKKKKGPSKASKIPSKATGVKKYRAEIERNWRDRIEAVKREGPYEDCEGATAAGLSDCEDRSDKIERLRKEMERELASQSCPAGSQIDFSRDREAIEEVLSTYLDTSEGYNQQFHEFRDITERSTQCGEIKVTAVYTMDHAYAGGASMPNEPYTREAVFIKKNNKFYVSRVGN